MKALIATACVAVIAVATYFFWGEYQGYRERVQRAESLDRARAEIFDLAKAKPHEIDKVRAWCKHLDERIDAGELKDNDLARGVVRNCRYFDYL